MKDNRNKPMSVEAWAVKNLTTDHPILPVGACPVVEMVPRELYEESKKQTADALVEISRLNENLTESVEKLSDMQFMVDIMDKARSNESSQTAKLLVERDNLKAENKKLFVVVCVLIVISSFAMMAI